MALIWRAGRSQNRPSTGRYRYAFHHGAPLCPYFATAARCALGLCVLLRAPAELVDVERPDAPGRVFFFDACDFAARRAVDLLAVVFRAPPFLLRATAAERPFLRAIFRRDVVPRRAVLDREDFTFLAVLPGAFFAFFAAFFEAFFDALPDLAFTDDILRYRCGACWTVSAIAS